MRPFWFLHEHALRDLERQLTRGDLVHPEQVRHCGEEFGVVQRVSREVNRYIHEKPTLLPVPALTYRSLKHPTSHRADQPCALSQRKKIFRWNESMHRV